MYKSLHTNNLGKWYIPSDRSLVISLSTFSNLSAPQSGLLYYSRCKYTKFISVNKLFVIVMSFTPFQPLCVMYMWLFKMPKFELLKRN
jgi:hypothetical protein